MPFEELTEEPDRPWERPGAVRRDCEPHRAGVISFLGHLSLVFGVLGLFVLPALVSLPLGGLTWAMAHRDLKKMRAGLINPEGYGRTNDGRECAIAGIGLTALYLFLFLLGAALMTL